MVCRVGASAMRVLAACAREAGVGVEEYASAVLELAALDAGSEELMLPVDQAYRGRVGRSLEARRLSGPLPGKPEEPRSWW